MLTNFLYILLADRISADGKSRKIGLPKGLSVLHNLLANLYSMDWCNESDCTKKSIKILLKACSSKPVTATIVNVNHWLAKQKL